MQKIYTSSHLLNWKKLKEVTSKFARRNINNFHFWNLDNREDVHSIINQSINFIKIKYCEI